MTFNLDAYLARIGCEHAHGASLDTLDAIAWAHVRTIPFENLDIVLDRPIRIDLDSVATKLVDDRRGGYCFEHNTLLAEALRTLGFGVVPLAARVRQGATGPTPRTHMLLEVSAGGRTYLADVGFGGACPTRAIPLEPGEHETRHGTLRLREDAGFLVLETDADGAWSPLYAFTREPHAPIDFEVANHYTSTHPKSFFTTGPVVALTTPEGRLTYRSGELTDRGNHGTRTTAIATAPELLAVLADRFGLAFLAGTRFRGGPP